jgi:serine/threonine protein kinase
VLAYVPATGTEPWHAPEHVKGAPTPADDNWATASLLHLMLTG